MCATCTSTTKIHICWGKEISGIGWDPWIRHCNPVPVAYFAACYLQQILPRLNISSVKHANLIAREVINRENMILCLRPSIQELEHAKIVVCSDAVIPHQVKMKKVAQEGCMFIIAYGTNTESKFHTRSWLSHEQRRSSHSKVQVESISAITSVGCATQANSVFCRMLLGRKLTIILVVDRLALR